MTDVKRDDRGVRQAAFWVLLKSACPSVLVEMGFVSNKAEEQYLASDKGKREITEAIFGAFDKYYAKKIGTQPANPQQDVKQETPKKESTPVEPQPTPLPATTTVTTPDTTSHSQEIYHIQIFAARSVVPEGDARFMGLKNCKYFLVGNWYKYTYGTFQTLEEAKAAQQKLQQKFPDCFLVKEQNNTIIMCK